MLREIVDNKQSGFGGDVSKGIFVKEASFFIAAAYFTLYAFQELKSELEKLDEIRFIFVEELRLLPWLNLKDLDDTSEQFMKGIHLSSWSFTTFYDFYSNFHYALQLLEVAEKTGQFVSYEDGEFQEVIVLVEQIAVLEAEIEHYRKLIKEEYNVKIRTLRQQCEVLKSRINA